VSDRLEITQQVLAQLGNESEWNLTQAMQYWWRAGQGWGLQLSPTGYGVFQMIEYPSWQFELTDPVTGAEIVRMDRYLARPWALMRTRAQSRPALVLFDSAQAMWLKLLGDFSAWNRALEHDAK
jgi:hypothetical protein